MCHFILGERTEHQLYHFPGADRWYMSEKNISRKSRVQSSTIRSIVQNSATGARTKVAQVKAKYPNQLDYGRWRQQEEMAISGAHGLAHVIKWFNCFFGSSKLFNQFSARCRLRAFVRSPCPHVQPFEVFLCSLPMHSERRSGTCGWGKAKEFGETNGN